MTPRTSEYRLNNTTFRVIYGDLTKIAADALVSSDDNYLTMGGGVSMALSKAGGEEITREARKHIPLKLGDVAVTSAGRLPAKFLFHAVTIDHDNSMSATRESIQAATLKCLQLADTLGVRHIAFPALGTGVARFPFQLAAEVMTRTVADYLMGDTHIALVTLTLFAREMVRESDLNLFYEQVVALASVSSQTSKLSEVLTELHSIVGRMQKPDLSNRVALLKAELLQAQSILAESPQSLEQLDTLQDRSGIAGVTHEVVAISSETQEAIAWDDRQLEAEVLRTRLSGLLTQLNIQYANLNKLQIKKAKYGSIDVPLHIENAIEDLQGEINETETRVQETRIQLVALA
jgi:O-acetyl-ADP-ribose deacetylase (regulator of RNase III)